MIKGFREFIMRGNVVDLAVAVVIGAAFKAVVDAFVADIVTPIIAAIGGKPDFSTLKFTINKSAFFYGAFINTIISFLIVAAAIYFFVVLPLNKLAERRAARLAAGQPVEEPAAKSEDVVVLEQIRDLLQSQQGGSGISTTKPSPGI
jgi:large conductance mechanosensitive channel